jgi:hypothetical protein
VSSTSIDNISIDSLKLEYGYQLRIAPLHILPQNIKRRIKIIRHPNWPFQTTQSTPLGTRHDRNFISFGISVGQKLNVMQNLSLQRI